MNKIKNAIRTIPNFPIDGIMFRDVTTLYSNSEAMKEVIKLTCTSGINYITSYVKLSK